MQSYNISSTHNFIAAQKKFQLFSVQNNKQHSQSTGGGIGAEKKCTVIQYLYSSYTNFYTNIQTKASIIWLNRHAN